MAGDAERNDPFPETLWTMVLAACAAPEGDPSAHLATLAERYRGAAVAWFVGQRLSRPEAEDLTHEFLQRLLTGGVLRGFCRRSTRFRVFLASCLRNQLRDHFRRGEALKRGGAVEAVPWEDDLAAGQADDLRSLDASYAEALANRVLQAVRADWERKGWAGRFAALTPYLWNSPEAGDYAELASRLGVKPNNLRQLVFALREEFFTAFRREVAATVAVGELNDELRHLVAVLGRDPSHGVSG
jgi:DNA-directed RNA polymerase specialized sigma24 family protein